VCQGLLPSRRHIEKPEDPGDEVAENAGHFFSLGWYSVVIHSGKVMSSSPEYGIV